MALIVELGRGHIDLEVSGRKVTVLAEISFTGQPDYVVYTKSIVRWADGKEVTDSEREEILSDLRASMTQSGLTIGMDNR